MMHSVSFPVEGVGHRPSPFQKVPEVSQIGCKNHKQTPEVNSQELDPVGGCGERQMSDASRRQWFGQLNIGPRQFYHKKVAAQEACSSF